jgi:hypothetical protein
MRRCPVCADMNIISAYGMKERISLTSSFTLFMVYASLSSTISHLFTAIIIPLPES